VPQKRYRSGTFRPSENAKSVDNLGWQWTKFRAVRKIVFVKDWMDDPLAGSAGLEFVVLRGIDFKKCPVSEPNVVFSRRNM
jgi:hypothetical protein